MAHRVRGPVAVFVVTAAIACQPEQIDPAGAGAEGGSSSASSATGGRSNTGGRSAVAGASALGGRGAGFAGDDAGGTRSETGGRATGGEQTGGRATGGDETGGGSGEPAGGSAGGGTGGAPTGGVNAGGGGSTCVGPAYSDDCSQVPYFQCGFEFWCDGAVAHVQWHEHVMCGATERIYEYACSYPCTEECDPMGTSWPDSGETLVDEACVGAGQSARRVFVTSTAVAGDFGGVAAGDLLCQELADGQELGGTWKAWLSDGSSSPSTAFTRSASGYLDLVGNVVAYEWARLLDDPIRFDETGTAVASDAMVWTGTDEAGDALAEHCDGWTSTTGTGAVGQVNGVLDWTSATAQDCSVPAHLYCFEQ